MEYWGSSKDRLFKLVKVRGKGLGYIALQDIEPGTLLISEPPVLIVFLMGGVLSSAASIDVTRQFCEKSPTERKEIMSLFNKYEDEENEILGIFKTNAMIISSWKSALFPKICRANHSCVPNCNYVWNPELGQQQMFLVKKVFKGEELTVTYLPDTFVGCREERRAYLLENNNFHCTCLPCSQRPGMVFTLDEYNRANVVKKIGAINRLAPQIAKDLGETESKLKYKSLCLGLLGQLKKMHIQLPIIYLVKNNLFTISTLLEDKEMALMWAKDLLKMSKVMTGRSEHTAAWSYVIKNVRKIFRDKTQLQEDVKSWSLEI